MGERKKNSLEKVREKIGRIEKTKDRLTLLLKTKSQLGNEELTEALVETVVKNYGNLGYVLSVLKERPKTFNPYLFKSISIYKEPSTLDKKTAELAAVSAAAALRCEHCLEVHMHRAAAEGASLAEIMDTLLIAGSISESSSFSVSFRKFKQLEAKMKKGKETEE